MNSIDPLDIPDLLANLVERSLVVFDLDSWRYGLSESLRAFLVEQPGEDAVDLERKHFEYFTKYAELRFDLTFQGALTLADQMYRKEEANFRSAVEWAIEHDPVGAFHLITRNCTPWHLPYPAETLQQLMQMMARVPDLDDIDHVWARVLMAIYFLEFRRDDEAVPLLHRALEQEAMADDPRAKVVTLSSLGWAVSRQGLGKDAASKYVTEALAVAREHGARFLQSSACTHLAEIARSHDDLQRAEDFYSEALRLASNDNIYRSLALFNLGSTSIAQHKADRAEEQFQESLRERQKAGSKFSMSIGGVGYARVLRQDYRTAGLLLGFHKEETSKFALTPDPVDQDLFDRMCSLGYEKGGELFARAFQEGAAYSYDQALEIALNPPTKTTD